ncbi:hypothetical protein BVX99_03385 [bacterium F16]|nr:hypothetical protein BVX99_03385 [bacterium F16]
MSIKQKNAVLSVMILTITAITSCSDYRSVNEKNPYFQKAQKAQQRDDYKSAAAFYLECLKFSPDSSKAHLQLALIYEENQKNYPRAIIHYKAFLDAVGQNQDISRMLARVEKLYMAELYRKYKLQSTPPPTLNALNPAHKTPITGHRSPTTTPYTVAEGDNLSTISINVYGTSKHWNKIFEANRDQLATPERVKVGQTLKIPRLE